MKNKKSASARFGKKRLLGVEIGQLKKDQLWNLLEKSFKKKRAGKKA